MLKNRKGFTLVELVVVVAIIAILALIAVPRFMNITESSRVATLEANHQVLVTAITMYSADKGGALPAGIEDLKKYISDVGTGGVAAYFNGKPADATYTYTSAAGLESKIINLKGTYSGRAGSQVGTTYTLTFLP